MTVDLVPSRSGTARSRFRRRYRATSWAPQSAADFAAAVVLANLSPAHWQVAADVESETRSLVEAVIASAPGQWVDVQVGPATEGGQDVLVEVVADSGLTARRHVVPQEFLRRRRTCV